MDKILTSVKVMANKKKINVGWASEKIQKAYSSKGMKELYPLIRWVFGPQSSAVVLLKSKDRLFLFKDHNDNMKYWSEHFRFFTIHQLLMNLSSIIYLKRCYPWNNIEEINIGKAPGHDCIPIEILLHGGVQIATEIHNLTSNV